MPKLYTAINAVLVLVSILYPFIWYFGQKYTGAIPVAVLMAIIWLLRAWFNKKPLQKIFSCAVMLLFVLLAWWHSATAMYWYPVMMNMLMLLVFGASLFSRQSIIERLARLQHPDLPETGVHYTRRVTQIWCGFFCMNILLTTGLILGKYWYAWTVYTGVISYLLMGILFGGEFLYRRLRLKM
ncbi:hypothetical protein [Snodgrassella alvi]|jgi:uncharacterized membrane protein|uniref:DNA gyrase subunit B n=1 Tax=Snodgrassella alvi TaxID=1196083 RepID=A0A855FQ50_9NEIS|nr:hypothetical protein [Snodgrassella alvi]PIT12435.1 hypothetical protein BGI30_02660 [Snodgrassella alvi]PIT23589.1 hypothetical protein BGI37_12420 [Snodgrassella alvi]PIT46091.1 hypothetical protein BHC51_07585 [Snodgrassella alvi]PIT55453.1 hypothetical protein BHC59_10750 [Snodgrassella alvi]PIT60383.1 hypothetical protein BHC57_04515 [Snodgrassella alvi]